MPDYEKTESWERDGEEIELYDIDGNVVVSLSLDSIIETYVETVRFSEIKSDCDLVEQKDLDIGVGRIDRCGAYLESRVPCNSEKCPRIKERD